MGGGCTVIRVLWTLCWRRCRTNWRDGDGVGKKANCLTEAWRAWRRLRGKQWLAVKRSVGKHGRIPHFAVISVTEDALYLFEYAPPEGRRKHNLTDAGAFPVLFDGWYYVRRYRLDGVGAAPTFEQAVDQLLGRSRDANQSTCRGPSMTPAEHAAESAVAVATKAAPPVTISAASLAGLPVNDLVLWATLVYTTLLIGQKLFQIYRDVTRRGAE